MSGIRKCSVCSRTETPLWRVGPYGPKTLCNACGVRWKKGKLVGYPAPPTVKGVTKGITKKKAQGTAVVNTAMDVGGKGSGGEKEEGGSVVIVNTQGAKQKRKNTREDGVRRIMRQRFAVLLHAAKLIDLITETTA